ncbi:MAG TPA: class I SAM-dependent methyltransferase [Chloroflexota bacterium]|nr:class I SAM-dependent methyltransferase [Chloroflexota bacterium]
MTARDVFRAIGTLTIAEGLALAIGGRAAVRLAERVVPDWYRLWLRPLGRASPPIVRALGLLETTFGLWLLAMMPPAPRALRDLAVVALEPLAALWQATFARLADQDFDDLLRQYVPPGARVLDLGSGVGDNLARLLSLDLPFGSYLGVDPSPEALARARARFDGVPKIEFVRNDLLNEPLPLGEFDLILSTWALDRIEDPFALIVRAMRQLRHGGHALLLFASVPRDWRAGLARFVAPLVGRQLRPASIYHGLPSFTAEEEFGDGLVSLVILENPAPLPLPISVSPPEQTRY